MKKYKIPETTDGWIKFWVINMKPYYDEVKKIYDEYVKVILPKTVTWVSDGTDVDYYIYGTEPYVKIPPKRQYSVELEVNNIRKAEPHIASEWLINDIGVLINENRENRQ
ncbi:MAG: hypothetical protein ACTSV7_09230 [Candidatus Baldrarchaeia archaeon]